MKHTAPSASTRMVIVGKTGTGKSFWVKDYLRAALDRGVRVCAIDVCDEYSRSGVPRNGLTSDGPLRQRVTFSQLLAAPQILKDARLSLAVVPDDIRSPRAMAATFLAVVAMLRSVRKPTLLVADEVGRWTDSSADPRKPSKCHMAKIELEAVATVDRKNGLALICVSQSASHIPIDVRRQSDEWVCFLQDSREDVEAMEKRLGTELAAEVSRLGRFKAVIWRDSTHNTQAAKNKGLRAV